MKSHELILPSINCTRISISKWQLQRPRAHVQASGLHRLQMFPFVRSSACIFTLVGEKQKLIVVLLVV